MRIWTKSETKYWILSNTEEARRILEQRSRKGTKVQRNFLILMSWLNNISVSEAARAWNLDRSVADCIKTHTFRKIRDYLIKNEQ